MGRHRRWGLEDSGGPLRLSSRLPLHRSIPQNISAKTREQNHGYVEFHYDCRHITRVILSGVTCEILSGGIGFRPSVLFSLFSTSMSGSNSFVLRKNIIIFRRWTLF